jgi:two-component system NtrC family sensor kinase
VPYRKPTIINIGLVGGGSLCEEILEKTTYLYKKEGLDAPILAVADPDPESPGMALAKELGLVTLPDYQELYEPKYNINLIIILTPAESLLQDILKTRPPRIRIMSHHVFEVFWNAIGLQERRWRDRTKEMETILNGIQSLISVISPDMEILDVNAEFLKKMGCSREQVIGRKCWEVFQRRGQACEEEVLVCPLKEAVRTKRPNHQVMTRGRSDGKLSYLEVSVYPIWEKEGKISKFIDISRDITEHKREEEEMTRRLEEMVEERTRELKETHNKLLHQDKMASLGKLSASVVHEINNPIAGILNLIMLQKRIIQEESIDDKSISRFSEYLSLMETETRRISQIVSNLLAFSRQSKMELRNLNLNQLIDKTLLLSANLLKIDGVKVEKRLDPNLPDLVGSEDQLQQVFMNFISNAAEVMETNGGGVLRIATEHSLQKGKIFVSFKDTGTGIASENLSRVFEPFFTTKKKGKGVGLGLSLAYGIIQEHGGSIDVKSKLGKGTTFRIEFPLNRP